MEDYSANFIWYTDCYGNEDYVDLNFFPFRTREDVEEWLKNQNCKIL